MTHDMDDHIAYPNMNLREGFMFGRLELFLSLVTVIILIPYSIEFHFYLIWNAMSVLRKYHGL